ncbi:MAG: MBL fold metallo-hydrolase [Planctomycetes bacterium]|nr:MBL fold metallo-hydrolase [Planctomycetota bacterium]
MKPRLVAWRPHLVLILMVIASAVAVGQVPLVTIDRERPVDTARAVSMLIDTLGPQGTGITRATRKQLADELDLICTVPPAPAINPLADPVRGPFIGGLFRERVRKVLHALAHADPPRSGIRVHKLYSSTFIVQSADKTVAFDFSEGPFPALALPTIALSDLGKLADHIDLLLVSHVHPDHFSTFFMAEMVARSKPVVVPAQVQNFMLGNGYLWAAALQVPAGGVWPQAFAGVPVSTFQGRQWISFQNNNPRTPVVSSTVFSPVNNSYVVRIGGHIVAHFGDNNDVGVYAWLYGLQATGSNPDVILQVAGLAPVVRAITGAPTGFLGHEWEFTHTISNGFTRLTMPTLPNPQRRVLFWGESYDIP